MIEFSQVQSILGITGDSRAKEIVQHIMQRNISQGMSVLNSVNNDGLDILQFNRELVEYLRELLLVKTGAADSVDLTGEDISELKELANKATLSQILNAVKFFGQIVIGNNDNSTLPLELALVECYLAQDNKAAEPVKPENQLLAGDKTTPVKAAPVQTRPPAGKPAVDISEKASDKTVKPEPVTKTETAPKTESAASPVKKEVPMAAQVKDAPAAPPVLSSEIERLRLNWRQILEDVPSNLKKTSAIALLRSAGIKPAAIENDTVVLSLKYNIYKDKMEQPEYQQVAEKIISDFLGRSCKIRCICETENNHLVRNAIKLGAQVTSVEEK